MIEPLRIAQTTRRALALIPLRIACEEARHVMGPGLAELRAALAAQNIAPTGPWLTHHVRNPGAEFDFEICLPVAAAVAPTGRVRAGEWPAMRVVQTTYHGSYEGLGAGWGAFMQAIAAAGHRVADGLWECYAVSPADSADPSAWRTELSKALV